MNHAGEISTLVRIAEPDVRVWTNVGEAHLGFFASVDAIADAKAEILEGADAVDAARRQRRRRALIARSRRRFAGRVVTFGIDRDGGRARHGRRATAASTARARDVTTPAGAVALSTTPLVGRGNLAERPGRHRRGAGVRRAARRRSPSRASACRPATHRGEVVRAGERRHGHRRQLQRESVGARRALDVLGRDRRQRAARGRARRDARARRVRRRRCTQRVRPRRGGGRRRRAGRGRRSGRRRRWRHAARRRRAAARMRCTTSRRATTPPIASRRCRARAISCSSRDRAASDRSSWSIG